MPATLKVVSVPNGRTIVLTPPKQTIGRSKECDIFLKPETDGYTITGGENDGKNSTTLLSRRHAEFACIDGRWTITDLGSLNGTKVNSKGIGQNETYLDSDDKIDLGGGVDLLFDVIAVDDEPRTLNLPSGAPPVVE